MDVFSILSCIATSGLASSPPLRKIREKRKKGRNQEGKGGRKDRRRGDLFPLHRYEQRSKKPTPSRQNPVRSALPLILYSGQSKRIKTISLSITFKYDVIGENWIGGLTIQLGHAQNGVDGISWSGRRSRSQRSCEKQATG